MKPLTCSRLFEAEATRDGRLTGPERASFERHARACAACARELAELEALAETLRVSGAQPSDELHGQREKRRLLAAFDRGLLAPARSHVARRRLVWAAAAVVLLALSFRLWRTRSEEGLVDADAARAVVRAGPATVWSKRLQGDRELVVLEHGTLWIRVDHATSARRVVVALPDAELEDIGTIFTVSAEAGHTARVAVQEGRVMLRLRDQSSITIDAGGVWMPPVRTEPATAPSAAVSTEAPSAARPPPPSGASDGASSRATASSAPTSDAATHFRDATAALNRGDNAEAGKEFARFLQLHPRDARAEDAAYLRVIALQRSGDHAGMNEAANDFLRRYPNGFRRTEVEGLLR